MKKTAGLLLSLVFTVLIFATPVKANAATLSSTAGTVSVTSGTLNVRSSGSSNSTVISSLKKGSFVTLISKSGSWWKVEYAKDKYGYCHADYIKSVLSTAKTVKLTSGTLNVRSGAGTSYSRVAGLKNGEIIIELSSSGGWSRVLYHGTKTGYVSSNYLTTASSSYSAVSLSVPSYKQTDSRWANVKIGSSGKTISQIGCATTAIAMIESYRTKTTVYPDAMSKKLSYTSSGSVYWPSHYTAVTSSSNYLNKIYTELKDGKAVLFGAKNSKGSQHWVVITGFKGGSSLTAAGFTINDPGSNSRTNLQQFLNSYPNFYKYFTY